MPDRWITEYLGELVSNQRHQLLVTVSKHLHVLKNGSLAYQKKAMDVNLKNVHRSARRHVVHFLVIDAASGSLYGEVHLFEEMPDVIDFLYRAWAKKERFSFCGIPETLDIPDTVYTDELAEQVIAAGVRRIGKPESGFKAGIRYMKTWEDEIYSIAFHREGAAPFNVVKDLAWMTSQFINNYNGYAVGAWERNLRELRLPPEDRIRWGTFYPLQKESRSKSSASEPVRLSPTYIADDQTLLAALPSLQSQFSRGFGSAQLEQVRLLLEDLALGFDRDIDLNVSVTDLQLSLLPLESTLSLNLFVHNVKDDHLQLKARFSGTPEVISRVRKALERNEESQPSPPGNYETFEDLLESIGSQGKQCDRPTQFYYINDPPGKEFALAYVERHQAATPDLQLIYLEIPPPCSRNNHLTFWVGHDLLAKLCPGDQVLKETTNMVEIENRMKELFGKKRLGLLIISDIHHLVRVTHNYPLGDTFRRLFFWLENKLRPQTVLFVGEQSVSDKLLLYDDYVARNSKQLMRTSVDEDGGVAARD